MAHVVLAPEVFDDFDRFFDHLAQFEVDGAPARIADIIQALQILTSSPCIGRKVKHGKRELVMGRDSRGYAALYRYLNAIDTNFVLAIRSQRELAYKHGR